MRRFGAIVGSLFVLSNGCAPLWSGPSFHDVPILVAAEAGDASTIHALLDGGTDVDAKDLNGHTALMIAANVGNADVVSLLIERHADVNAADINRWTALMHAADAGQAQVARLLIAGGADVNAKANGKRTAIFAAARMNTSSSRDFTAVLERRLVIKSKPGDYVDTLRALLDAGADVNAKNHIAETPLMWAVSARPNDVTAQLLLIRLLIERGANVNARGHKGETALMRAARNIPERPAFVRFLLEHGADVNAQDKSGGTALTYAPKDCSSETVVLLKKAGATGRC